MAVGRVPDPFAIRSLAGRPSPPLRHPKSLAVAASLAAAAARAPWPASIVWTLGAPGHPRRTRLLAHGAGRASGLARPARRGAPTSSSSPGTTASARWLDHPARLALGLGVGVPRLSGRGLCPAPPPGSSDPAGGPCQLLGAPLAARRCSLACPAVARAGCTPRPPVAHRSVDATISGPSCPTSPRSHARAGQQPRPQPQAIPPGRRHPPSISAISASPPPSNSGSGTALPPGRETPAHRPRRHRAAGKFQPRLRRERSTAICWCVEGNADIYGQLLGNLVTVKGDVFVHPGGWSPAISSPWGARCARAAARSAEKCGSLVHASGAVPGHAGASRQLTAGRTSVLRRVAGVARRISHAARLWASAW